MSLFKRNLAKCGKAITIEDRNERIINGQTTAVFSNARNEIAITSTLKGISVFDNNNIERVATHKFCLNWRNDVGAEQWVTLVSSGKRIKILTAENCCENDEILILMCTERGEGSEVVTA